LKLRAGDKFLLFLSGHLCCLAGFEWCRLWSFFPTSFRPWTTLQLTLAYTLAMWLAAHKPLRRNTPLVLLVVWWGTVFYPLWPLRLFPAIIFPILAVTGSILLPGRVRWIWVFSASVAFSLLYAFMQLPAGIISALLVLWAGAVSYRTVLEEPLPVMEPEPDGVAVEIFWRGFAQLYAVCLSGEGERFSRQVLDATMQVVESCGGVLESGSEHRGIYRFADRPSAERCGKCLVQYGESLDGVLKKAGAPSLQLIFQIKKAARS